MSRIPIAAAKRFALEHGLRQVCILGLTDDGSTTHIITYGKTKKDCKQAAIAQDWWSGKVCTPIT